MLKIDPRTVKKAADKILHKRKRNKREGFMDISDQDVRQLKTTMVNNPLLMSGEVFTMPEIASIKQCEGCRILKQIK